MPKRLRVILANEDDSVRLFPNSGLTSLHIDAPEIWEEIFVVSQQAHLRAIVNQDGTKILDANADGLRRSTPLQGRCGRCQKRGEPVNAITQSPRISRD
jgi:hypothetical protein